ncbi:hypothetical protein COB55_03850, partial [Candidatus Wolfebacteria bacterium]
MKTNKHKGAIIKWDYESVKGESLKYYSMSELRIKNQYVYKICVKNKWIDEFFPKEILPEGMKRCSNKDCEDPIKSLSEFPKRKDSLDGHGGQCKRCMNIQHKNYVQDNEEGLKKYRKNYYKNNKEERKKYNSHYYK